MGGFVKSTLKNTKIDAGSFGGLTVGKTTCQTNTVRGIPIVERPPRPIKKKSEPTVAVSDKGPGMGKPKRMLIDVQKSTKSKKDDISKKSSMTSTTIGESKRNLKITTKNTDPQYNRKKPMSNQKNDKKSNN